jgi:hypothetical protein
MPKLGISEHEIVKISKNKGTLEIFSTNFGFLHLKDPIKFVIQALYENLLEPNLWLVEKRCHFFWIPTFLGDPVLNLGWIDTLYGTYSSNS